MGAEKGDVDMGAIKATPVMMTIGRSMLAMHIVPILSGCAIGADVTKSEMTKSDAYAAHDFGMVPASVLHCTGYDIVLYEGITTDEANRYVDGLIREGAFVVYDNREPNVSASFIDKVGNSITVAQMPNGTGGTDMSITVIRAGS